MTDKLDYQRSVELKLRQPDPDSRIVRDGQRDALKIVQSDADRVYQVAALPMPAPKNDESIGDYRVRLLNTLKATTSLRHDKINAWAVRDPAAFATAQADVARAVMDSARASGELRPIRTYTRSGLPVTEWCGPKKSWMREYQAPAFESAVHINGEPRRLPTIIS
ncbi:hypothetical protein [Paraburkholderia gardini]|uniref:hypothetical protein n=1 Tax=Paraburkholderia gardini TaxID=2823469 RepID=UPI001D5FCA42|nr:hypothetical protein [Paraburkholderia gardini]CAG4924848.1 hypothetical protein R69919_05247 [Paraburkholderia gardini]